MSLPRDRTIGAIESAGFVVLRTVERNNQSLMQQVAHENGIDGCDVIGFRLDSGHVAICHNLPGV